MRYILLVLFAFVTTFASAQVQYLGSPTTTVRNRGNFVSDSLFYLPKRQKLPSDTGALRYQISDSALYVWTGSAWRSTGTAGSAITGSGVAGYMPEFTTSTNLDTTRLYHSAGRFAIGSTTTTNGVFNVIGGTTYLEGNLSFGAADRTISNISNNVLAFGTNNTERMRIGANGDVAIGTTNADPFTRGDDRRIAMDASGISSTANVALSLNAGSSAGRGAQLYLGVGGTRHFEISSNSVEQGISAISNTYIKFLTNNTERMRLKADGELLIGTTTDAGAYALQVAGAIYNTTGAVLAASSGDVGIGTTLPNRTGAGKALSINAENVAFELNRGDARTALIFTDGNAVRFNAVTNIPLHFGTNNIERVRITTDGNFGINTTTPSRKLHVVHNAEPVALFSGAGTSTDQNNGGAIIGVQNTNATNGNMEGISFSNSNGTPSAIIIGYNVSHTTGEGIMAFGTRNSGGTFVEGFRLSSSQEVLIGTTTDAGAYAIQVSGAIYNTTTITTGAPTSGSAKPWRLGEAATVSPTSPNRTIRVEIDGTVYYIHAKTTND